MPVPRSVINICFAEADVGLCLTFSVSIAIRASGFSNGGLKRKWLSSLLSTPLEVTEGFTGVSRTANSFSPAFAYASYMTPEVVFLLSSRAVHGLITAHRADVTSQENSEDRKQTVGFCQHIRVKSFFSANQAIRLPATDRYRDSSDCQRNFLFLNHIFRKMTRKTKVPGRDGSDVPAGRTLRWTIQQYTQESSGDMSKILTAVLTIMHLFWTLDNDTLVNFCTSKRKKECMKRRIGSRTAQCNFTVMTAILDRYCSNS